MSRTCEACGVDPAEVDHLRRLVGHLRGLVKVNFDLYHEAMEKLRKTQFQRDVLRAGMDDRKLGKS